MTVNTCETRLVDPTAAFKATVLGLMVSVPPPPPDPTVIVTATVCVEPPLTENEICPVYVEDASPEGFAVTE